MHADNQQAVDLASYVCGSPDTWNAYLHYCFLASRDLVTVRFQEIEAVADALLERETLSYQDVLAVIKSAPLKKNPAKPIGG